MGKFDSPIGSKQFSGQPMRDFSVPDESGYEQPPQMPVRQRYDQPAFDERAMQDFERQMQRPMQQPAAPMRDMSDIEQQIYAAKKAKREGKERLSDGAKRRIEMLLNMVRLSREVEIGGQMYKLQTLTGVELRDALVATAEFDGTIQFIFETRKQLLARSLVVVSGVEIDQFLNSRELEDRLYFIELLDHALLIRLYSEYTSLAQEAQDKYSPKTDAQIKELVDDLKK